MSAEGVTTRPFARDDVPRVRALVNAEGWAFTDDDLHRLVTLGGGVVAEADDALLGALTLTVHAEQAWIGNVVVAPDARGRGVGARLVDAALERARDAGVPVTGLYSVLPAVSLYERAGFTRAGEVASFTGRVPSGGIVPDGVRHARGADLDALADLDARAAGTRRERLLAALLNEYPEHAFLVHDEKGLAGFVIGKPSETGAEIGPLVTREPGDARVIGVLLDAALAALPGGGAEAGAHRANPAAMEALEARGFKESFPALTMYHGEGHQVDPLREACVAGMEKG